MQMIPTLVLLTALVVPAADHVLLADDWARPRTGDRVAAMPAVRAAVAEWLARRESTILVVHPGGEAGTLWGAEVRDWLVALGVDPDHVVLRPGGPRDDAILLRFDEGR